MSPQTTVLGKHAASLPEARVEIAEFGTLGENGNNQCGIRPCIPATIC